MDKKPILFFLVFVLMSNVVFANVIVFSNYKTSAEIKDDGTLHIIKQMTLKNTGRSPIIPGELHFRMYEADNDGEIASLITGYGASGHFNEDLDIRKNDFASSTELVVDVWEPILPGFVYTFKVEYDVNFEPKGLLFYDITLPEETTTIPIQNQLYELTVPKNKHITYTMGGKVSDNKVVWVNVESPMVEYSILPIPKLPIRAVNVFWITTILILSVLLLNKLFMRSSR